MTVYKGCFLVIKRNIWSILMYIFIFAFISSLIEMSYQDTGISEGFTSKKLNVAVIDREGGTLARTICQVLEKEQNLVELADDRQVLQEALFYGTVDYVLIVPEEASLTLQQEDAAVQSIMGLNETSAFYAESQVNVLLNQIRACLMAGFSMEEACEEALQISAVAPKVELIDANGNAGIREGYNLYFGYMPYAFLGATVMSMSVIIMEFKKKEISRRMRSSATPFIKQNAGLLLSFAVIGLLIWVICIGLHVILYRGGIFTSPHALYYILNSLVFMVVSLSLAYLTGILVNNQAALSGMCNVISLGLCFLGGVFVPMEMLGGGTEKVARFLPTYWYSRINGILGDYGSISAELQKTVGMGIAIQLLFAAACFALSLMIRRVQLQEKE